MKHERFLIQKSKHYEDRTSLAYGTARSPDKLLEQRAEHGGRMRQLAVRDLLEFLRQCSLDRTLCCVAMEDLGFHLQHFRISVCTLRQQIAIFGVRARATVCAHAYTYRQVKSEKSSSTMFSCDSAFSSALKDCSLSFSRPS